jgi:hypothetical protein
MTLPQNLLVNKERYEDGQHVLFVEYFRGRLEGLIEITIGQP